MSTAVTPQTAPADGLENDTSCRQLVDVPLLLKDAHAALFPFLVMLKGWTQVQLPLIQRVPACGWQHLPTLKLLHDKVLLFTTTFAAAQQMFTRKLRRGERTSKCHSCPVP